MFSFFKKSKRQDAAKTVSEADEELGKAISDLKAEMGDKALMQGMNLLDRVNALRSVKLSFFQSLLELADNVSNQVVDQYESFGKFNSLEVQGFCASIITTAISVINLPEDEKPICMDIYLGLWVDSVVQHGKGINGPALKDQIVRVWSEYRPLIIGAATEPVQYIIYKSDSAAMRLVSNVDRLAGVTRDETQQHIVATRFKSLISEVVRIVDELTTQEAVNSKADTLF